MEAIKNTSLCIIWKYDAGDKRRWNLNCDYMASAVIRGRKVEINGNSIAYLENEMKRLKRVYGHRRPQLFIF